MIDGGVPLSGELTPAGNKNAALPILAACLLTEEELLLHRVPRIRDTEAQIALLERLGVEVAWVGDNSLRLCARRGLRRRGRRGALQADPRLVPARRAAAGALRRGADAAARRRLHRPPPARRPPRRLRRPRRRGRGRPLDRAEGAGRRAASLRDLHGRALGDGDRERADGGGADAGADDDLQRRLRAARAGPGAPAERDGLRGERDRLQRDDRARARPARRRRAHDLARPHRGRQLHGAGRGDRAASCGSATRRRPTC